MVTKVFIQARMSSSRFPGKVLAPLNGIPIIKRVVDSVATVFNRADIVVATSSEISDDPLSLYVEAIGVKVLRGSLDDVFGRFRLCLEQHPCDWFFRISADSPMLNSRLLEVMNAYADDSLDLVTNVLKRTFPHGHSLELLRAKTFSRINPGRLSDDDREHVTKFYYSHNEEFRILNLENTDPAYAGMNFVVDTLDDLRRVSEMEQTTVYDFSPELKVTQ